MTKAKRVCPIKGSGGGSAEGAVSYAEEQSLTKIQKDRARRNIGAAKSEGEEPGLIAGDLASFDDRVTIADQFVVRTTAVDESIDSSKDALLLEIVGGTGATEDTAFKINAMRWNRSNALDPSAWASGKTSGYILGHIANGAIESGSNKIAIIRCPKCEAGEYGTAEKNNGYLITRRNGTNMHVGDGTIIAVAYSENIPSVGTEVETVEEHTFSGHSEKFYLPEEGFMVVEIAAAATLADIDIHLAWSKDYNVFAAYQAPAELTIAVSALTSKFETATVNGKTCLILRGIEDAGHSVYDRIVIYAEGGGTYQRNIAKSLLTSLTWTETTVTEEDITKYRYTAVLPTSGTYAAKVDCLMRCDVDGMTISNRTLCFESETQITPATEFAGKYVDYEIATPVTGTHTINPAGKKPDDMATEEVVGDIHKTGTIVISYCRGFRDTMLALVNDFRKASEQIQILDYTKPKFCVGEWLENALASSSSELDNPDALAVFGDKDWAMDWRPFLVDMTATQGEVMKRPKMELKKNNWLRDIYGNWAPVVGITQAQHDACMTNALYTDAECTEQYCAAGAFNPEEFVKLCSVVTDNGKKKLSIPKLYTDVDTEVTHYLMPWETVEKKYSIFVGRKDEVYLMDNMIGASGKEWNGILGSNCNFWDGADLKMYALKPTGICPSPITAISDNGTVKSRCFFFNYPSNLSGTTGYNGLATNCELFYGNGHYPYIISQIGSKTYARNNNSDTTAPFPVAEGGWHARNTFLRCIETAMGTKNLCAATRFSGGINSNNAANDETTISVYGGVRWKKSEDSEWGYSSWGGNTHGIYKNATGGKEVMVATLNNYSFHSKVLEDQIAVSFAVEFGITAGETYIFNGCEWRYENVTPSGTFNPKTIAQGEMNCRSYKTVKGTFSAYNSDGTAQNFDVECVLCTGLMLGCNMSGDGGPYWGGGCEIVGECETTPASGSYGYELKAYIEPDQTKWINEGNTSIDIGQKFSFEDKYKLAGSVVTRANNYIRRRMPHTPLPVSQGGGLLKGESGYGSMANYWGAAGKRTRVGVRCGYGAYSSYLSARSLFAYNSAGIDYVLLRFCSSIAGYAIRRSRCKGDAIARIFHRRKPVVENF